MTTRNTTTHNTTTRNTTTKTATRWARENDRESERGFVAGAEAMVFGVLGLLMVALIIANGWAIINAKFAVTSASREATRTYVEIVRGGGDTGAAIAEARTEAQNVLHGYGRRMTLSLFDSGLAGDRCDRVTITVDYRVPFIILPGITHGAAFRVAASHSERVDPYRSGITGEAACTNEG